MDGVVQESSVSNRFFLGSQTDCANETTSHIRGFDSEEKHSQILNNRSITTKSQYEAEVGFKTSDISPSHVYTTKRWYVNGVRQPEMDMATLVGKGQDGNIHSNIPIGSSDIMKNSIRKKASGMDSLFPAEKMNRDSAKLPRVPQCSATYKGNVFAGQFNTKPRRSSSTPRNSVTRFCETHKWQSSADLRSNHQGAPDALYRYTYGTAECEPSTLSNDVDLPTPRSARKVNLVFVSRDSSLTSDAKGTKQTGKWDPNRHLKQLTGKRINASNNIENTEKQDLNNDESNPRNKRTPTTPKSPTHLPLDHGILYSKVRSSIDLFQSYEAYVGSHVRPLSRETTGRMSEYAYRRDKPKRGRSIAALDYANHAGNARLRRTQTAPNVLRINDKDHKSADAYIQYVEQSRLGGNTSRTSVSPNRWHHHQGSRSLLRQKSTPLDAVNFSAPPPSPKTMDNEHNRNNSNQDIEEIRLEVTTLLRPNNRITNVTDEDVDIAERQRSRTQTLMEDIKMAEHENQNKHTDSAITTIKTHEINVKPEVTEHEDMGDEDAVQESKSHNNSVTSKREVLTVDLRSAVGNCGSDEGDTVVSMNYEL